MAATEKPQVDVPSDQSPPYGKRGAGGVIGPDEKLVFVMDLVDVH